MSYEEMMTLTEQHLESQVNLRDYWGGVGPAPLGAICAVKPPLSLVSVGTPHVPRQYQLPVSFCPHHRMSPKVPGTR